jgi:hypothetical protein
MKTLTLEQMADYLENAAVHQTIDRGHALIHMGESMAGHSFVLVNDVNGNSVLTEGF